jgi:hypothetical protein
MPGDEMNPNPKYLANWAIIIGATPDKNGGFLQPCYREWKCSV